MRDSDLSVLSVISNPSNWRRRGTLGGGEVTVLWILKRITKFGANVYTIESDPDVYTIESHPETLAGYDPAFNVNRISLPFKSTNHLFLLIDMIIFLIRSVFLGIKLREKIDVVFASNGNFTDVLPSWIISKITGKHLVVKLQVDMYPLNYSTYKKLRLDRSILDALILMFFAKISLYLSKSAKKIFCLSEQIKKTLSRNFKEHKFFVTSGFVDLDYIDSIKVSKKIYDGIYFGRVEFSKGIIDVLKSWGNVVKVKPKAKLMVVGTGSLLEESKKFVNNRNMQENVIFYGFASSEIKFKLLKESRIFLSPAYFEGWGLSVVEALACGLPAIVSNIPTFVDLYNDLRPVKIVPLNNPHELALAILYILDRKESMNKYKRLSKKFVSKFILNEVAKKEFAELLRVKNDV